MISAPNTISSRFDMRPGGICTPSPCSMSGATVLRKIGSSTMNAAPRNDPRMLPTPPMITMNSTRNDRSRLKPSGSTVPRYAYA